MSSLYFDSSYIDIKKASTDQVWREMILNDRLYTLKSCAHIMLSLALLFLEVYTHAVSDRVRRCSPCTRPPGWWFPCGHGNTGSSAWSTSGPTERPSSSSFVCLQAFTNGVGVCEGRVPAVLSTSSPSKSWRTGSDCPWPVRYLSRWAA